MVCIRLTNSWADIHKYLINGKINFLYSTGGRGERTQDLEYEDLKLKLEHNSYFVAGHTI
jgi:hypothetical protein